MTLALPVATTHKDDSSKACVQGERLTNITNISCRVLLAVLL